MQQMTRRQWLFRVGSAAFVPAFLSSCRPEISRDVEAVGKRFADAYTPVKTNGCVACDNCMPCPYNIDIPSNLLFVDRAHEEDWLPGALDDPDFSEKGTKFLARYEDSIPDVAQTQRCISCGECIGTCPVGINIPEQMSEITALTDVLRDLRCQQL